MAKYQARHSNFGFYADGVRHKFREGVFITKDKKLQDVLDNLPDVQRIDEPKEQKPKAESKPKASAK
jgi:hypothetical protein